MAPDGRPLVRTRMVASRTFVVVTLGVMITGIYVAMVVGLGSFLDGSDIWLSVLATTVVAGVFEPARAIVQRTANRLVYGKRATPYEVLGGLARLLAYSETGEALLERLVTGLRDGTGARRAIVWQIDGRSLRPIAVSPATAAPPKPVTTTLDLPGQVFAIGVDDQQYGHLTIEATSVQTFSAADLQLAEDLAGSATLVLRKLALTQALEATASELERSRVRLVRAQDDELRRLERELSAGVEQQIVALKAKLEAVGAIARCERMVRAADVLEVLATEAEDAIDQIHALAQGIYPHLLSSGGLDAALEALVGRATCAVTVRVHAHELPAPVGVAIYFCVAEALTNVSKHGHGPVAVTVSTDAGRVELEVADSGPGFDVEAAPGGSGLHNMADRFAALGGVLTVRSAPGGTTTVRGQVPIPAPAHT